MAQKNCLLLSTKSVWVQSFCTIYLKSWDKSFKSTPCIFVDYRDEEFKYKLWDPMIKKIDRRMDIVFLENQFYMNFENPQGLLVKYSRSWAITVYYKYDDMQDQST